MAPVPSAPRQTTCRTTPPSATRGPRSASRGTARAASASSTGWSRWIWSSCETLGHCFGFQCFLSSDDKVHHSTRDLCELACREPGRNGTCKSTGDWVESGERANRGLIERLSLRPGAPCDNFQGYCDVFLKCRQVGWDGGHHEVTGLVLQVDAEGPLVRLKNLLFNQRTLLTIAQWVTVS